MERWEGQWCGIALSYEPTGITARCVVKACVYPGRGFVIYDSWRGTIEQRIWCWWHFMTNTSPLSIEYQDADVLCGIPRHHSRDHFNGKVQLQEISKMKYRETVRWRGF